MARKQTPAPSFAPITTEIANAIDAVLDRVWFGVNTRSEEDEEKKWLDSWMSWMPERK